MRNEEWRMKKWFNWVNEECGSFLLSIINRCKLSFLQRLHVTNWPVGSTAALRLSGSWQSYSIVARRSTTPLCRWSLSFSTWVSRVTNERRIIITDNRRISPSITENDRVLLRMTEYYWDATSSMSYLCIVFQLWFPYLSLRCALCVPTVCKGNEGKPKVHIWFT